MMKEIEQKAQSLALEINAFESWEDKYTYIIQKGRKIEEIEDDLKIEKYQVKGCQSQVWLVPELKEGHVFFRGSSDASLVKGIVSLLLHVYSGHTPSDILDYNGDFLTEIGINQHLSMNRTNGLASMLKQIKMYAIVYQSLEVSK